MPKEKREKAWDDVFVKEEGIVSEFNMKDRQGAFCGKRLYIYDRLP